MCVPVSIGFGKTALIPARIECRAWQMCVRQRKHTATTCGISVPRPGFLAKNLLPTQAPEWITVPRIAHLNPTETHRTLCPIRQLKLYIRDPERTVGGEFVST